MGERNGNDVALGQFFGQMQAGKEEQIRISYATLQALERIEDNQQELPDRIAEALMSRDDKPGLLQLLSLTPKEAAAIIIMVAAGLGLVGGGKAVKEAVELPSVSIGP